MFDGMQISATGLTAENLRLSVVADNLANQDTTNGPGNQPYRSQFVVLRSLKPQPGHRVGRGVAVQAVLPSLDPFTMTYDPGSPNANAQGDVRTSNVHLATQMTDLIAATAAYNANATAFNAAKAMEAKALTL